MITADGGDGEGVSGQCVDFGGRELGSEIEDVGAIGPFDVAVVSGSDGDDVVGIEVVPGDLTCGVDAAAPSPQWRRRVMAEISGWSLVPVRVMVTTLGGAEVSLPAPESSRATTLKERVRVSSLRRKSRF